MVTNDKNLKTAFCIIGSRLAAHTGAIYAARAELSPILFEVWLANGLGAGGQLTTTTEVENFPGFPDGISGQELTDKFRSQSLRFRTKLFIETVKRVALWKRLFKVFTDDREVEAETLLIATGPNKVISACAVCDGAATIFRNKPLAVIGDGDSAMEEATFLTKYSSIVYIIHRRDTLRASKIMQKKAVGNEKDLVGGLQVKNLLIGEKTNADGYIITKPETTQTSVQGVFADGDAQHKKWQQAITSAGTGCMAALEAEHFLQEHDIFARWHQNGGKVSAFKKANWWIYMLNTHLNSDLKQLHSNI
ncbi:hypothetical protein KP509_1Z205200 [Ceratopteris richardii]|nr:hypothetical protein KP509_1Z205200 [Ceratopteris richardii]